MAHAADVLLGLFLLLAFGFTVAHLFADNPTLIALQDGDLYPEDGEA